MKCLICPSSTDYGDLCKECWLGLKCFQRDAKRLGRAITYLTRKGMLITKRERRKRRKQGAELAQLIGQQRKDEKDRNLRLDHAIRK